MGKILSFVASVKHPGTMRVRDDGQEAKEAVRDHTGKVVEQAQEARPAWPEGAYVVIKDRVTAGDQEKMTELTYKAIMQAKADDPNRQEMKTEVKIERAALASAAVMIVAVEGEAFVDPDTCERDEEGDPILESGRPLDFAGHLDRKLDQARRLPFSVCQFIDNQVAEINKNPLGLPTPAKPSNGESGQA